MSPLSPAPYILLEESDRLATAEPQPGGLRIAKKSPLHSIGQIGRRNKTDLIALVVRRGGEGWAERTKWTSPPVSGEGGRSQTEKRRKISQIVKGRSKEHSKGGTKAAERERGSAQRNKEAKPANEQV